LAGHDALATVGFARRVEAIRNKLCLVDHAVIDHCEWQRSRPG